MHELALEVAAVVFHAVYSLVYLLQLGDGELLVEEGEGYRAHLDGLAQVLACGEDYLAVVEGEGRQPVLVKPLCVGSVVAGDELILRGAHQRYESHGDDSLARVAVERAEHMELVEVNVGDASFLSQLAHCSPLQGLVDSHEASGQRPHPLVRLKSAFYQKQLQRLAVEAEDNAVNGQCRMGILVGVRPVVVIHPFRLNDSIFVV